MQLLTDSLHGLQLHVQEGAPTAVVPECSHNFQLQRPHRYGHIIRVLQVSAQKFIASIPSSIQNITQLAAGNSVTPLPGAVTSTNDENFNGSRSNLNLFRTYEEAGERASENRQGTRWPNTPSHAAHVQVLTTLHSYICSFLTLASHWQTCRTSYVAAGNSVTPLPRGSVLYVRHLDPL